MRDIIVMDGGMGQELVRRSGIAPTPLWSARIMLDNPQLVHELYLDYIAAGAKIIGLNNYTATRDRLNRDASVDLLEPIHAAAVKVAHEARKASGATDVKISGCLAPLFASYKPELAGDYEACLERYRELASLQADHVDLFIVETAASIREGCAAAKAGVETGKPTWLSYSLDDDVQSEPRLRSGETLAEAIDAAKAEGVEAILINCSMPETIDRAVDVLTANFPLTGAYANGFQSVAALTAGGTVAGLTARNDLGPNSYAEYAMNWVERGLGIIGGCCEVGPDHIAYLSKTLHEAGYTAISA